MSKPTPEIFGGEPSVPLWEEINAIPRRKARHAVYHLACKCQELEAALGRAMERIETLERGASPR